MPTELCYSFTCYSLSFKASIVYFCMSPINGKEYWEHEKHEEMHHVDIIFLFHLAFDKQLFSSKSCTFLSCQTRDFAAKYCWEWYKRDRCSESIYVEDLLAKLCLEMLCAF